ncbi:A24 family peptidase [uncultured Micrococcus sp.]|uniref:prepilin peptidase n=1 Tax=uncultured Micrococcus sp. TaxID=114051 RepID=UPI0025D27B27|nr:A24 family peptidase [uncultured Micrococcus sp.]
MATGSSPETAASVGAPAAPTEARPYRMPTRGTRRAITLTAAAAGAAICAGATHLGAVPGPAAVSLAAIALQLTLGVPIAVTDFRHHRIPNWLVSALALATLAVLLTQPAVLLPALAAAAATGVGLFLLNLAGGMGMGDVKLIAVCALAWGIHGPGTTLLGAGLGFVLSMPAALTMMHAGRRHERIPMGPGILAGSVLTLIWSLL